MGEQDQLHRDLGEIKGLLTGLRDQVNGMRDQQSGIATRFEKQTSELTGRFDKMDERLRAVEKSGAVAGAVTGGVVAVAIGLIKGVVGKSI